VNPLGVYGFWIALILALVCMSILVNIRISRLEKLNKEQIKAKISK
jgi:Na+-driven multidrug efflux pump